ncbi:MAG TPA: tetratricopeptide repeat protein [Candidatus Sulfotelmatobacter sp.]|nr:tetratricopeptide repeat protein [Candidatus Sulfotelmatobacter sp.]
MTGGAPLAPPAATGQPLHLYCIEAFGRGAIDDLFAAVDAAPFEPPGAAMQAAAGAEGEAIADALCRIGLLLVEHGRSAAAVGAYRVALAYWPRHSGALLLLGRLYQAAGDFVAAEACVRDLVAIEPADADARRELAQVLFGGGRLTEADQAAQAALRLAPFDAAAWHVLGQVRLQRDRPAPAAAFLAEAVRLDPLLAAAWGDLAEALRRLGRDAEAEAAAGRFAALGAEDVVALRLQAEALTENDRLTQAEAALQKAVALAPDFALAWSDLGRVQRRQGQMAEAEASIRRFVALRPRDPDAHNQLGLLLFDMHQFAAAAAAFTVALGCRPDYADTFIYLGEVHARRRKLDLAEANYRRALELDPHSLLAHNRLAVLLTFRGRPAEAAALLEDVLSRHPDAEPIKLRLGGIWCEMGRLADAERIARAVLAQSPRSASAHTLLGRVQECLGNDAAAAEAYIAALRYHQAWAAAWLGVIRMHRRGIAAAGAYLAQARPARLEQFYNMLLLEIQSGNDSEVYGAIAGDGARLLPQSKLMRTAAAYIKAYDGETDDAAIGRDYRAIWGPVGARPAAAHIAGAAARPLRVGYVGQYLHPTLMNDYFRHHDFDAFEIHLYSDDDRGKIDPLPAPVRWHAVKDTDMAQSFRANRIDLCVDILGPLAFGPFMDLAEQINRRIAPAQCSWIDTFASFGGSAHDFIIADPELVPPEHEADFVERIIRLPVTHWSCQPPKLAIEPGPLPALRNGHITFGVANRAIKLTDAALALWAAAMRAVPGSRLRLFGAAALNFMLRQRITRFLAAQGIEPGRIDFSGPGSQRQVLEFYQTVDIALDTYPYSGGITGFETLWMGVPLVTRTGRLLVSRQARSMLACIGRRQWIAVDAAGFVAAVAALAGDLPALARERATLRQAVVQSPLCQGERFARDLETAFRTMAAASG